MKIARFDRPAQELEFQSARLIPVNKYAIYDHSCEKNLTSPPRITYARNMATNMTCPPQLLFGRPEFDLPAPDLISPPQI